MTTEDQHDYWADLRDTNQANDVPIDTFKQPEDMSDSDEEDIEFQDMQLFLQAIEEPQLIDVFMKNKVTLAQLLEFNEQDLINCGVELVGDRKKILDAAGQMHCEKWMPTSLNDMTAKSMLSSPGIYITLNDINKHLEYIGVTFKYLRRRIEERPEILELGKDYVGVPKIFSELEDLLRTSKMTYIQLKTLQKEVRRHLNDPAKLPANHIDDSYIRKAKFMKNIGPILLTTVAMILSYKVIRILT